MTRTWRARWLARRTAVGIAAVVLLGACGDGDDEPASRSATVLDIAPIVVGEPDFRTGANGTVTMTLATTIDVGCSIVFGPTPEYGALAVDVDMSAGAHDDHVVILGELAPGSVVHYSLQGADETGQLYQGEDMTFVVPPPGESTLATGDPRGDADGRENLALGAAVTASSEFGAGFAASNAVDGNPATEWSSRGDGDDAFLVVDLGEDRDIGGIGFWTRAMSDGTAIVETIRVLVDGEDLGVFEVGRDLTVVDLDARGREVRIEAETTTGGNTGAVEIEVHPRS